MEIPCSDWVSPSAEGVGLGFPCRSFKEEEHSRLPVIETQPTETHRSDSGLSPLANEAADGCHISQKVLISNTARQTASEMKVSEACPLFLMVGYPHNICGSNS